MACMVFPQDFFELKDEKGNIIGYEDGFNGIVHTFTGNKGEITDNLCTRILLLEDGERAAIVALEVAQSPPDQVAYTKSIVSEICKVKPENVWVHTTHQFGFMHRPKDIRQAVVYDEICKAAVREAATGAMESFEPALMGYGRGESFVSENKNIENPPGVEGGPYYGRGSRLETDRTLTMLRFQSVRTGKDIGFFMSHGTKPSALCTTGKTVGNRRVNTEVTGHACKLVEEEFGVPCIFCMPAAGDQYPRETAQYFAFDKDGKWGLTDIGFDEGIRIVDRLGAELGDDAVRTAAGINCTIQRAKVCLGAASFDYANKAEDGFIEVTADALALGDLAFLGFKQEMDCVTGMQIQAASPYEVTILVSFLNGDGKYFGHLEAYDFNNGTGTCETKKSAFAKGAAEQFVKVAIKLLEDVRKGREF
ncbi:MAG: hypothetical protein ACOX75_06190 [Lachnospiraceae bacterium]|jgi:hypothetical protein